MSLTQKEISSNINMMGKLIMFEKRYKFFIIFIIPIVFLYSGCATFNKDTPDFYLIQGKSKIKDKDYISAISYLQKVEKIDTNKIFTPESLLLIGKSLFQQSIIYRREIILFSKDTKQVYLNYLRESRGYFERVIKEYPNSSLADDAQFNIGLIFDWDEMGGVNNFAQALIEYQKVIDNYPESSAYSKAKARIELINSFYGGLKDTPHDIK